MELDSTSWLWRRLWEPSAYPLATRRAIVNGGNFTGKLLRGDLDQWTFTASAGDAISLAVSEVGTNTTPAVDPGHGPNGSLVGGATGNPPG
jgi:hypothetical protein